MSAERAIDASTATPSHRAIGLMIEPGEYRHHQLGQKIHEQSEDGFANPAFLAQSSN